VALYKTGSAYFAPGGLAIAMAESFVFDRKRVLPARRCSRGSTGINGFFMGVPVQIGSGGVEKIIELKLDDAEKAELQKSFTSVKKTVDEVKL
jgi:malate dehydrogenase